MTADHDHHEELLRQRPPYTSFKSFSAFIKRAATENVPGRVDSLLLNRWEIAAGNESALLSSLRALGLISESGQPTHDYLEIRLSLPRRQQALRRCALRAYARLPGALDPDLPRDQLYDYFVGVRGLRGQLVDKAMRFYRELTRLIAEADSRSAAVTPPPTDQLTGELPASSGMTSRSSVPLPPLVLAVSIPLEIEESALIELFQKIQRCWRAASDHS